MTARLLRVVTGCAIIFVAIMALTLASLSLIGTFMAVGDARVPADFIMSPDILLLIIFVASSLLFSVIWRRSRTAFWASVVVTVLATPIAGVGLYASAVDPSPPIWGFATAEDLQARHESPLAAFLKPTEEEWEASNDRISRWWVWCLVLILAQFAGTLAVTWRSQRKPRVSDNLGAKP